MNVERCKRHERFFQLFVLAFLVVSISQAQLSSGFENFKWGMSVTDVKTVFASNPDIIRQKSFDDIFWMRDSIPHTHSFYQAKEVTKTHGTTFTCEFFEGKLFRIHLLTEARDPNVRANVIDKIRESQSFPTYVDNDYLSGLDSLRSNGTVITSVRESGRWVNITLIFKPTYDSFTKIRSKTNLTQDIDNLDSF
jgi:hypothetical protein